MTIVDAIRISPEERILCTVRDMTGTCLRSTTENPASAPIANFFYSNDKLNSSGMFFGKFRSNTCVAKPNLNIDEPPDITFKTGESLYCIEGANYSGELCNRTADSKFVLKNNSISFEKPGPCSSCATGSCFNPAQTRCMSAPESAYLHRIVCEGAQICTLAKNECTEQCSQSETNCEDKSSAFCPLPENTCEETCATMYENCMGARGVYGALQVPTNATRWNGSEGGGSRLMDITGGKIEPLYGICPNLKTIIQTRKAPSPGKNRFPPKDDSFYVPQWNNKALSGRPHYGVCSGIFDGTFWDEGKGWDSGVGLPIARDENGSDENTSDPACKTKIRCGGKRLGNYTEGDKPYRVWQNENTYKQQWIDLTHADCQVEGICWTGPMKRSDDKWWETQSNIILDPLIKCPHVTTAAPNGRFYFTCPAGYCNPHNYCDTTALKTPAD